MINNEKMKEKPRCLVLLEETIRSTETYKIYKLYLDKFLEWSQLDYTSFLSLPSDELLILLQDYMIYLKKNLNPNSVSPRLAAIDKFLRANDKEYKKDKIRMLLPEKVKPAGEKAWSTDHIQIMLQFADSKRAKAIIHFLAASGCRIGALEGLKLKHLGDMPKGCKFVKLYAGTKWECAAFLHQEATKAMNDYLEERKNDGEDVNGESYVFRERYILATQEPRYITRKGAQSIIKRILERAVEVLGIRSCLYHTNTYLR